MRTKTAQGPEWRVLVARHTPEAVEALGRSGGEPNRREASWVVARNGNTHCLRFLCPQSHPTRTPRSPFNFLQDKLVDKLNLAPRPTKDRMGAREPPFASPKQVRIDTHDYYTIASFQQIPHRDHSPAPTTAQEWIRRAAIQRRTTTHENQYHSRLGMGASPRHSRLGLGASPRDQHWHRRQVRARYQHQ